MSEGGTGQLVFRVVMAAVFVFLAVAWGAGAWGGISGSTRWVGAALFAALAVTYLLRAAAAWRAGQRNKTGRA